MLQESMRTPENNNAVWIRSEDDIDDYVHHKCSSCGEIAIYDYIYEEDFDYNINDEPYSLGIRDNGIREHITKYCPSCGKLMGCP